MQKGAQPTEPVAKLLEISGAMSRYKIAPARSTRSRPAPEPEETAAAEDEASTEEAPADEPATDEPTLEEAEADTADDTEREEE
jgi:hypothetical protein